MSPYAPAAPVWQLPHADRATVRQVLDRLAHIPKRQRPPLGLALLDADHADLYLEERLINGLPTVAHWRLLQELGAVPSLRPIGRPIWLAGRLIERWAAGRLLAHT